MTPEAQFLIANSHFQRGLSTVFAVICIVDVFGVFPIVSLPKSIISCGISGIFVVFIVCGVQIYTAILLGRCWLLAEEIEPGIEDKNRYPYSALAEITYGKRFSKFVTFLLDITIFGGGIPNLLVAAQTLQLLSARMSENSLTLSFCYWIIVIGIVLCPLLWLGSPKDMKSVCTVSVCMVFLLFALVLSSILSDDRTPAEEAGTDTTQPFWETVISAYGIIAFQFDIHPMILTIQVDMKKKENVNKAILGGYLVSIGMFALVAILAYIKYGNNGIYPSILGNLPTSNSLHFAALLVALQLGLTCVVSNSALYQHIEDCLGISRDFNHRRCILRTSLTVLAVILAESVPRLEVMMSLVGGTFIGPLTFILPPLFFMKMTKLKKNHDESQQMNIFQNVLYTSEELPSPKTIFPDPKTNQEQSRQKIEMAMCLVIILFGICGTLSSTYLNARDTIDYATFSQPCIYNLTMLASSPL